MDQNLTTWTGATSWVRKTVIPTQFTQVSESRHVKTMLLRPLCIASDIHKGGNRWFCLSYSSYLFQAFVIFHGDDTPSWWAFHWTTNELVDFAIWGVYQPSELGLYGINHWNFKAWSSPTSGLVWTYGSPEFADQAFYKNIGAGLLALTQWQTHLVVGKIHENLKLGLSEHVFPWHLGTGDLGPIRRRCSRRFYLALVLKPRRKVSRSAASWMDLDGHWPSFLGLLLGSLIWTHWKEALFMVAWPWFHHGNKLDFKN